jgi:hypothetical protein
VAIAPRDFAKVVQSGCSRLCSRLIWGSAMAFVGIRHCHMCSIGAGCPCDNFHHHLHHLVVSGWSPVSSLNHQCRSVCNRRAPELWSGMTLRESAARVITTSSLGRGVVTRRWRSTFVRSTGWCSICCTRRSYKRTRARSMRPRNCTQDPHTQERLFLIIHHRASSPPILRLASSAGTRTPFHVEPVDWRSVACRISITLRLP